MSRYLVAMLCLLFAGGKVAGYGVQSHEDGIVVFGLFLVVIAALTPIIGLYNRSVTRKK